MGLKLWALNLLEALHHLSHTPSPFAFLFFRYGHVLLPRTGLRPRSSLLAGITVVYHHVWLVLWHSLSNIFPHWTWTSVLPPLLPNSWDYKHEPPGLTLHFYFASLILSSKHNISFLFIFLFDPHSSKRQWKICAFFWSGIYANVY
jgi:hypothetical protein